MPIYLSPFKLFNLSKDSSDAVLETNKEKVMGQLRHHSEAELVYIGSTKIQKGEVLKLLTELDNFYTRSYHIAIFEDKKLLNFLEYGHLNYFRNESKVPQPKDGEFLKFIATYFGYQYGETLLQAIKTQDKETLSLLSLEALPMVGDFEDQCYKYANSYVKSTIKDLKELQEKKELVHMSERELLSYLPTGRIELYNMLPDYFYATRNLIGNEVYELSVVLTQTFGRSDGASVMLKQGLKLKLDETVRKNLESMLQNFSIKAKVPNFIWMAALAVLALYVVKFLETTFVGG
jgi:hypothetical protein